MHIGSTQHRRPGARNGKQSVYYNQVKSAVTASAVTWNSMSTTQGDPSDVDQQQHDGVGRMNLGENHARTDEADTSNTSISAGPPKSEWSFAPAAAPKFMASAAWAGSRAAGAADAMSGGSGVDSVALAIGGRGGADWAGVEAGPVEVRGGWLLKKAESSWGWRRRWFVLYPGRLTYQASSLAGKPLRIGL